MKTRQFGRRAFTVPAAQILLGEASKAERGQIVDFIRANTEPKRMVAGKWKTVEPWAGVPYWLTVITHLDTGRKIITVGCAGPETGDPGMTANEIRKVVGLPPVKGGDYKIVKKERVYASAGGTVSLGKIKAGKQRLPSRSKGGK